MTENISLIIKFKEILRISLAPIYARSHCAVNSLKLLILNYYYLWLLRTILTLLTLPFMQCNKGTIGILSMHHARISIRLLAPAWRWPIYMNQVYTLNKAIVAMHCYSICYYIVDMDYSGIRISSEVPSYLYSIIILHQK